jgi:hypothetical protein
MAVSGVTTGPSAGIPDEAAAGTREGNPNMGTVSGLVNRAAMDIGSNMSSSEAR